MCRYFATDRNDTGKCISKCPDHLYAHQKRRCITKEECYNITIPLELKMDDENTNPKQYPYIPFNGTCVLSCPDNYHESENNNKMTCIPCEGFCKKTCVGASIDSISSAQKLKGCTHIAGSLEIQIRSTAGSKWLKIY